MPSTITPDTVEPGAVAEVERLSKLVEDLRSKIHWDGLLLRDDYFSELRERVAAGKTTLEDGPPIVEGDRLIPISEHLAYDKAMLDVEAAALAWIVYARREVERTGQPYPIPAELRAAGRKFAESPEFDNA